MAPLVSGFSFAGFCGDQCSGRLFAFTFTSDSLGISLHPFPSDCVPWPRPCQSFPSHEVACVLCVLAIYVLVAMTAFLDLQLDGENHPPSINPKRKT